MLDALLYNMKSNPSVESVRMMNMGMVEIVIGCGCGDVLGGGVSEPGRGVSISLR